MHSDIQSLFSNLWDNYKAVTPSAQEIHCILGGTQGHKIINDHIALRTFNLEKVNLDKLAAHFLALGYTEGGDYNFEAKKLYAKHYEHPDPAAPKVFISELLVEKFSPELQAVVRDIVDQVDPDAVTADNFLYSGTHWKVDYATYKALLAESEYAAWVAAWGYRANHFTVNVNRPTCWNNHQLWPTGQMRALPTRPYRSQAASTNLPNVIQLLMAAFTQDSSRPLRTRFSRAQTPECKTSGHAL